MRASSIVVLLCAGLTACSGGQDSSAKSPTSPSTVTSPQSGQPSASPATSFVNLEGRWDGDFQVTNCTANLDIGNAQLCSEFPNGAWLNITMTLWQQASNYVAGPLTIQSVRSDRGHYDGNVVGLIGANQTLTLFGSLNGYGSNLKVYNVLITSWQASLNGSLLACTFSMDFRQDGATGIGTVTGSAPGLTLTGF